jgi:periplasmic protein TonB
VAYISPPSLQYPPSSRENEEAGTVVLRVLIDEMGQPQSIKIHKSSGFVNLDKAAVTAIQKARFKPPTLDGQPTAGYAQIPLTFELEN